METVSKTHKKNNSILYGIIRISHSNQTNNNSLKKQKRALKLKGVPDKHILELVGSSRCGSNSKVNKKLEPFLANCNPGDIVLFTEPSRFSRCYFWAVQITAWLYSHEISVWPLTYNRPLPLGNALHSFFSQILKGDRGTNYNQLMVQKGVDSSKRAGQYKGASLKLSVNSQNALKLDIKKLGSSLKRKDLMRKYKISRTTLYRYIKKLHS